MKFEGARILIAVLDYPYIESECVMSILGMWEYSKYRCAGERIPRNDIDIFLSNGTSPARAHNTAVSTFLNHPNNYMHLMIIGHDHIFQPQALQLLYEADKDIINGVGAIRLKSFMDIKKPVLSIVSDWKDGRIVTLSKKQCLAKIAQEKYEPFEVPGMGNGVSLVKRKVFEKVPPPWFQEPPLADEDMIPGRVKGLMGCDVMFYKQARERGFKIWAHPGVQYVHIGRSYVGIDYPIPS